MTDTAGLAFNAAGMVFNEPRVAGERVLLDAATFVQLGDRQPRGRRVLAIIDAGSDGVHVRATPELARLAAYALAATAIVCWATRRVSG